MKKITFLILMPILIILLIGTITTLRAGETTKVLVEKTFDVSKSAKLIVQHEHGNVRCNNWDKDVISIKLIARAKTTDQEKAEKAFSRISWDVHGDRNEVYVHSKINNKLNSNRHIDVSIDLEIFMPKSISLDFENKFGNAFIEEVEGIAIVTSEYGAITVDALYAAESRVKIEFGSGKLGTFGGGNLSVSYGKLALGSAGRVSVRSEYSDFTADELESISLKSEGGNVKIGKVVSLKGTSSFGNLEIEELINSIDIETAYGSLIVRDVDQNFSDLNIVNKYGSAKLFIPDDATYYIEAITKFGSFKYQESLADFNYRVKSHTKSTYKGVIGKGSNPTSKVTVESSYGSVSLITK